MCSWATCDAATARGIADRVQRRRVSTTSLASTSRVCERAVRLPHRRLCAGRCRPHRVVLEILESVQVDRDVDGSGTGPGCRRPHVCARRLRVPRRHGRARGARRHREARRARPQPAGSSSRQIELRAPLRRDAARREDRGRGTDRRATRDGLRVFPGLSRCNVRRRSRRRATGAEQGSAGPDSLGAPRPRRSPPPTSSTSSAGIRPSRTRCCGS